MTSTDLLNAATTSPAELRQLLREPSIVPVLAILGAVITIPSVVKGGGEEAIRNAIADLGRAPHPGFQVLWRYPQRSTELLVAMLAPVARGAYQSGSHPPVVWYLRALRSLTGLNFRGTTNELLTEDEEHWLRPGRDRSVEFFGTWMSRDHVWVAPEDAQTEIIDRKSTRL